MQWFRERTVRRAHKKLVADLAEHQAALVRQSKVHCGFCGEGHIWAECYNLCNFCGGFGHLGRLVVLSCRSKPLDNGMGRFQD